MHTKNLENSSKIESFMGQNAQAHKLNLMSVYIYIYIYQSSPPFTKILVLSPFPITKKKGVLSISSFPFIKNKMKAFNHPFLSFRYN